MNGFRKVFWPNVGDGLREVASNICVRESIEAWGRGRGRAGELVRKFVSRDTWVSRDSDKIDFAIVEVQEELAYVTDLQNYGWSSAFV